MLEITVGRMRLRFAFSFFLLMTVIARLRESAQFFPVLLAIVCHETGHLLAMMAVGNSVKKIDFTAFGIAIRKMTCGPLSPSAELGITLAGPITNLLLALACLPLGKPYAAAVNLVLAGLQLLPVGDLDGGRALRILCEGQGRGQLIQSLPKIAEIFSLTAAFFFALSQEDFRVASWLLVIFLAAAMVRENLSA